MPDSLIEQVKRLAEAQRDTFLFDPMCNPNHARHASVMWSMLPALLAHMQAQQAVVDAALNRHEARKNFEFHCDATAAKWLSQSDIDLSAALAKLDAALERNPMAKGRLKLKWRLVKGEWRAGPFRISDLGAHLVNSRFAVYAVTTGGKLYRRYMANFATFLHSEQAAKRACESLAAKILKAVKHGK